MADLLQEKITSAEGVLDSIKSEIDIKDYEDLNELLDDIRILADAKNEALADYQQHYKLPMCGVRTRALIIVTRQVLMGLGCGVIAYMIYVLARMCA